MTGDSCILLIALGFSLYPPPPPNVSSGSSMQAGEGMCALLVDVTRFTKPTYVCSIFKPVVKNLRVHGLSLRCSAWKAFALTSYAADLFQAAAVNSFLYLPGKALSFGASFS